MRRAVPSAPLPPSPAYLLAPLAVVVEGMLKRAPTSATFAGIGSRSKLERQLGGDDSGSVTIASYTLLQLTLISGRDLPKSGEQRCIAEPFDRYCPASKFGRRQLSNKPTSVCSPVCVVEVVNVHSKLSQL